MHPWSAGHLPPDTRSTRQVSEVVRSCRRLLDPSSRPESPGIDSDTWVKLWTGLTCMHLAGAQAIRRAFPVESEAAANSGFGQPVSLWLPSGDGRLFEFKVTLCINQTLTSIALFVHHLGLRHGDYVRLNIRSDGKVVVAETPRGPPPSVVNVGSLAHVILSQPVTSRLLGPDVALHGLGVGSSMPVYLDEMQPQPIGSTTNVPVRGILKSRRVIRVYSSGNRGEVVTWLIPGLAERLRRDRGATPTDRLLMTAVVEPRMAGEGGPWATAVWAQLLRGPHADEVGRPINPVGAIQLLPYQLLRATEVSPRVSGYGSSSGSKTSGGALSPWRPRSKLNAFSTAMSLARAFSAVLYTDSETSQDLLSGRPQTALPPPEKVSGRRPHTKLDEHVGVAAAKAKLTEGGLSPRALKQAQTEQQQRSHMPQLRSKKQQHQQQQEGEQQQQQEQQQRQQKRQQHQQQQQQEQHEAQQHNPIFQSHLATLQFAQRQQQHGTEHSVHPHSGGQGLVARGELLEMVSIEEKEIPSGRNKQNHLHAGESTAASSGTSLGISDHASALTSSELRPNTPGIITSGDADAVVPRLDLAAMEGVKRPSVLAGKCRASPRSRSKSSSPSVSAKKAAGRTSEAAGAEGSKMTSCRDAKMCTERPASSSGTSSRRPESGRDAFCGPSAAAAAEAAAARSPRSGSSRGGAMSPQGPSSARGTTTPRGTLSPPRASSPRANNWMEAAGAMGLQYFFLDGSDRVPDVMRELLRMARDHLSEEEGKSFRKALRMLLAEKVYYVMIAYVTLMYAEDHDEIRAGLLDMTREGERHDD